MKCVLLPVAPDKARRIGSLQNKVLSVPGLADASVNDAIIGIHRAKTGWRVTCTALVRALPRPKIEPREIQLKSYKRWPDKASWTLPIGLPMSPGEDWHEVIQDERRAMACLLGSDAVRYVHSTKEPTKRHVHKIERCALDALAVVFDDGKPIVWDRLGLQDAIQCDLGNYSHALGRLLHRLPVPEKGSQFEEVLRELLERTGFSNAIRTKKGGDGGIDFWCERRTAFGSETLIVQAKNQQTPARPDRVQALAGACQQHGALRGILICTGGFTQPARLTARAISPAVHLVDLDELTQLLCANLHHMPRTLELLSQEKTALGSMQHQLQI